MGLRGDEEVDGAQTSGECCPRAFSEVRCRLEIIVVEAGHNVFLCIYLSMLVETDDRVRLRGAVS